MVIFGALEWIAAMRYQLQFTGIGQPLFYPVVGEGYVHDVVSSFNPLKTAEC